MSSWTRRRLLRAALGTGGAALLPWPAAAQQKTSALLRAPRRALVIGNSSYQVSPLKNPANDARAMAEALKHIGFDVTLAVDLPRDAMLAAAREYTDSLAKSKPIGLFYFAGHGMQLAWRNYLVPIDAIVDNRDDIQRQCIDVNAVIEGIARAVNPMNVIVLDACRDNPFGRDFRVEQKGLSQLDAPHGTLLAYATSPGNVASDGAGANGLYTEHLLREMRVPEAKIEDVFKRVRLAVRLGSNGRQVPWESTSLEDDFWFIPPKELKRLSDVEAAREFKEESALWKAAEASGGPGAVEAYLKRHPSGRFAELAQAKLDSLLRVQGETKVEVVTSADNPYSKGFARTDTNYKIGDSYTVAVSDLYSKVVQETVTNTVTRVTENEVHFDTGSITDRLGNVIQFRTNRYFGSQMVPAEFQLGRQWRTQYAGEDQQWGAFTIEGTLRIVARETIKVGAGTFDTFRVEVEGARYGSGYTNRFVGRTWYAPEQSRRPVLSEQTAKSTSGYLRLAERRELVAFKQA